MSLLGIVGRTVDAVLVLAPVYDVVNKVLDAGGVDRQVDSPGELLVLAVVCFLVVGLVMKMVFDD